MNHLSPSHLFFPSIHAELVGAGPRQAPPTSRTCARPGIVYRVSQITAGSIPPKQSTIPLCSLKYCKLNLYYSRINLSYKFNIINYFLITLRNMCMLYICFFVRENHNSVTVHSRPAQAYELSPTAVNSQIRIFRLLPIYYQ